MDLPYVGSRAMLKIRSRWVTSHYSGEQYKSRRSGPMQEYCKQRYNWTDKVFNLIHWASVGNVRRKLSTTMQTQTCKIMHDWLPTGHMRQWKKEGTYCPGCDEPNETLRHIWQCPMPQMTEKRKTVLSSVKKIGKKNKIPQHILEALCHVIQCEMDGKGGPMEETSDTHIKTAI